MSSPTQPTRYRFWNTLAIVALLIVGSRLVIDLSPAPVVEKFDRGSLRIGCATHYPYLYDVFDEAGHRLTGMDVELTREAFRRAGYDIELLPMDWSKALEGVKDGTLDAAAMSFRTPERETWAYFSDSFYAINSAIFYRRDRFQGSLPRDPQELLAKVVKEKLSLGYSLGFAYPTQLQTLLADPTVSANAHAQAGDSQNLTALIDGTVDVAIADRLGGTSLVLKNGWSKNIGSLPLALPPQDVHLMFSKKLVRPQVVADFNEALAAMTADRTRAKIVRAYYFPSVINLLAQTFWFDEIAVLAAAAAAISGIFLARKMGTNLVGAFILAAAPAAGGGLIRDLIAGRRPVGVVADPSILLVVLFLVVLAFLIFRVIESRSPGASKALDDIDVDSQAWLIFFDALGLAAFTVFGVMIAMIWRCEPLWLWGPILAATTNAGGSALRDVIVQRPLGLVRSTRPYVEVSILWGWLLSLYLTYSSEHLPESVLELRTAVIVTVLGVIVTFVAARMSGAASPKFGVLPELDPRPEE